MILFERSRLGLLKHTGECPRKTVSRRYLQVILGVCAIFVLNFMVPVLHVMLVAFSGPFGDTASTKTSQCFSTHLYTSICSGLVFSHRSQKRLFRQLLLARFVNHLESY